MESNSPARLSRRATTTLRTGLNLTYDLTSRINSKAGVYYHHEENQADKGQSGTTRRLAGSLQFHSRPQIYNQ